MFELKYKASTIDEIEQSRKASIDQIVGDTSIRNLATLISKGCNNGSGCTLNQAMTKIDEYLENHDKDDLGLEIMEALVRDGFLSRTLDVQNMRELKAKRSKMLTEEMEKLLV